MGSKALMNDTLYQVATAIVPLVFAIVFHEVAHGWVAKMLGDPTAAERRRLSLNPLRHVDPMGTILLPGALMLLGLPVFGWAKPVPVDYRRLRNPKRDMALVAAAGPGTNLVLAAAAAVALGYLFPSLEAPVQVHSLADFSFQNLNRFLVINVSLAIFNLLPLPPFDGSRILRGVLPMGGVRILDRIEPLGIPIFMIVFIVLPWLVPGLHIVDRIILPPIGWVLEQFYLLASFVAGPELA
jgi:Zn-dependent protease